MVKVGDKNRIIFIDGEPNYCSKVGVVERIDDIVQINGSCGGHILIPGFDQFEVAEK